MIFQIIMLTLPPLVWGLSIFVRIALGPPRGRGAVRGSWRPRAWAAGVRDQRIGIASASLAIMGSLGGFYLLARWTEDSEHILWRLSMAHGGWRIGGLATLILALAVAVVGLWRDPSHGRRRCSNCWYDFAAADVVTPCPECGRVHRSERDLRRTRRSWRAIAGAAILAAASYFVFVGQRIIDRGAIGAVPSAFMIAFFEHLPEGMISRYKGSGGELADRMLEQELWTWQVEWLERRVSEVCLRAQRVSTIALCNELTSKSYRYPGQAPFHVEKLLDDALLHAADADDRTQTAVEFATWFASQDAGFDWAGWFETNAGRIISIVDAQGYASWGFEGLVLDRAPTDVAWFIVASRFTRAAPRTVGLPRLSRFLGRAGDPTDWLTQQLASVDGRRRFEFAEAVLAIPPEVDPAESPESWPKIFCEIAKDDPDPAVRELVRSSVDSLANP